MGKPKKLIVLMLILLIAQFTMAMLDKDISMVEYICLFAMAAADLGAVFLLEIRIEEQIRLLENQSDTIETMIEKDNALERIVAWNGELTKELLNDRSRIDSEIYNLPKVASATGQIYVDYDDVASILKGDKFVER